MEDLLEESGRFGRAAKFRLERSKNLKHAEVLYPAPHRFADANGTAIGYDDQVVFPVKLTPERAGEPIELKLAFAYGLCKDLCIPNDVSLSLTLEPNAGKGDAMLLQSALALVPKPARAGLLPEVSAVEAKLDGAAPGLIVEAVFPPGATGTDLYIDGAWRRVCASPEASSAARRRHAALCGELRLARRGGGVQGQASDPDARVG